MIAEVIGWYMKRPGKKKCRATWGVCRSTFSQLEVGPHRLTIIPAVEIDFYDEDARKEDGAVPKLKIRLTAGNAKELAKMLTRWAEGIESGQI